MTRRTYSYNGFSAQLSSPITAGSTSIALSSTTGMQAPCYLVIAPDSLTLREVVRSEVISAPTLENVSRGLAGSISGAQPHAAGVEVRGVVVHQHLDDIFLDIGDLETDVSGHLGGFDTADHPEATGSSRGFISATDKTLLDTVESGAEVNPTGDEIFAEVLARDGAGSLLDADLLDGAQGAAYSLAAHTHAAPGIDWAEVGDIADISDTPSAGSLEEVAYGDHVHGIPTAAPSGSLTPDEANAEGSADTYARSDHQHNIPAATPTDIGTANAEGSASSFARSTHVHRVQDMRAVGVTAGEDDWIGSASLAVGSYVDRASVVFTMPAGWNTALVVAWGSAAFQSVNMTNTSPQCRVEIGAANGVLMGGLLDTPTDETYSLNAVYSAVVSGTSTIALATGSGIGTAGSVENATVAYIAIRAS